MALGENQQKILNLGNEIKFDWELNIVNKFVCFGL